MPQGSGIISLTFPALGDESGYGLGQGWPGELYSDLLRSLLIMMDTTETNFSIFFLPLLTIDPSFSISFFFLPRRVDQIYRKASILCPEVSVHSYRLLFALSGFIFNTQILIN